MLADTLHITVESTGEMQYTAFKQQEPPRLIVDIAAATLAEDLQPLTLAEGIVSDIELQALPDQQSVRLLVHLRRMVSHSIDTQEQQLRIALTDMPELQAQASQPEEAETTAMPVTASVSPQPVAVEEKAPTETVVTDVEFDTLPEASVVTVQTSGQLPQMRVRQRTEPLRLILDMAHARLDAASGKVMAVHDPGGVVTQLQTVQETEGDGETVQIVAYLKAETPFAVRQEENEVRMVIAKPAAQVPATDTAALPAPSAPAITASQAASVSHESPVAARYTPADAPSEATSVQQESASAEANTVAAAQSRDSAAPAAAQGITAPVSSTTIGAQDVQRYTGEKISLDFQNADIHDILRLLAEVSGLNVITGPDVQGSVTTRMIDVPWDQALDVILKINGLAQEREENIIRIAPAERFITERQERLRAQQTEVQIEPTVTQVVPVNYAKAEELKTNLEMLLGDRGSIFVDTRTNTMIVNDTRRNIDGMLTLVQTLDRQTPQVMIESRIVEASRNFLRDLGIQLGARTTKTTDRKFPSTVTVGGSATPDAGNFLVDLPAAVATGQGGAISFALAGAGSLLNVRLSALERSGNGKIITNPKIATLDNTEAIIQSGRRIPFETVSQEGTQTEFADASISLRVTPHVTADGFINLKINATKNEADFANTSAGGVPTILTREASTEMLIKDGETVVIGGLYSRTIQSSHDGVPGLSKLPVIGWLFQQNRKEDINDELLIFITPRIIKQPEAPVQARAALSY